LVIFSDHLDAVIGLCLGTNSRGELAHDPFDFRTSPMWDTLPPLTAAVRRHIEVEWGQMSQHRVSKRLARRGGLVAAAVLPAIMLASGADPAGAAPACTGGVCTVKFAETGHVQSWTVPAGVTHITLTVAGGSGGNNSPATGTPGKGGVVIARLAVTPGQRLTVVVGGKGANGVTGSATGAAGGYGGGGAGGATPAASASVEGGGGGGGSFVFAGTGASAKLLVAVGGGGGAGSPGDPPDHFGQGSGGRGGNNGNAFGISTPAETGADGEPATWKAPGSPSAGTATFYGGAGPGRATLTHFGAGGAGAVNTNSDATNSAGGGGGGLYGGGGGSSGDTGRYAGGGGGGSGYVVKTATIVNTGSNIGNGSVTIRYA
jgi:hypothetical protein